MKNRSLFTLMVLVILAMTLPVNDVLAQRGRGGGRGGRGGMMGGGMGGRSIDMGTLLSSQKIRDEVEVTEDQYTEIKTELDEARAKREEERGSEERPNWREMSDEDREAFMKKMEKQRAERSKAQAKVVSNVLLPMQVERLDEIRIQLMGVAALANKEIAEKIGVSEDQIEKMKKAVEESASSMRDKMREMFQSGDMENIREKMTELRAEMENTALAQLSEAQKKSFEKLKGEKFEIDLRELMGGRGGRGGRGRGGFGGGGGDRGRQRPQRPAVE